MYCSSCGIEMAEHFRYCPQCGTATEKVGSIPYSGRPQRFLRRPREDRKIAGVCAGVARFIGIDVTLVRILFVVFTFWPPGVGLIVYIVCWIVMPQDPLLLPPARNAPIQEASSAL